MYKVLLTKKCLGEWSACPWAYSRSLVYWDLRDNGPLQPLWPNFSRLSHNKYHCHLSHKWVACWQHEEGSLRIEVYYAGSRENGSY